MSTYESLMRKKYETIDNQELNYVKKLSSMGFQKRKVSKLFEFVG